MRKIDRGDLHMWLVPFDETGFHLKPLAIWIGTSITLAVISWYWFLPMIVRTVH